MKAIQLLRSTGSPAADEALRLLIGSFERALPGRARGYYLEGSYADATSIATSDLDLIIVLRGARTPRDERAAGRVFERCGAGSPLPLDYNLEDEAGLAQGAAPMFKLASVPVFGDDIRHEVPLLPIDAWARQRMHAAYWLINRVWERPAPARLPVCFPNPSAPFFGYINRTLPGTGGAELPTTRNLIRVTGWAATALLAWQVGAYVARKRDCHTMYRQQIGDEWCDLLDAIYGRCRNDWRCLIPEGAPERAELEAICGSALAFENHFLRRYRAFVLDELGAGGEARRQAQDVLASLPLHDDEVQRAARAS
jgi:hypothetical protein